MKIIFLVKGNKKIGMGHVFRSLNLASELKMKKHKIAFFTTTLEAKKIIGKKFNCNYKLDFNNKSTYNDIDKFKPDMIIIDEKNEKSQVIKKLNKKFKTVGIDYTNKNKKLLDYSINILYPLTGHNKRNSFSSFKYAILNDLFLNIQKKNIRKKVVKILITHGGADTHCFTEKILSALIPLKNIKIVVVLGPSFSCWKKIQPFRNFVKFQHNVKNMKKLMLESDIAITGGGMTMLELCRMGIPSLVVCGENFENETANILHNKGIMTNLGFGKKIKKSDIFEHVIELINNVKTRKEMCKRGRKLIDGKGTSRTVLLLEKIGRKK